MIKLQANEISLDDKDDMVILGFQEKESSKYLILSQKIEEIDEEGETCYLEINDQNCGGYGLIEEIRFGEKEIEIQLNKKGFEVLKSETIQIKISVENFNVEYLKLTFLRIFKRCRMI